MKKHTKKKIEKRCEHSDDAKLQSTHPPNHAEASDQRGTWQIRERGKERTEMSEGGVNTFPRTEEEKEKKESVNTRFFPFHTREQQNKQ